MMRTHHLAGWGVVERIVVDENRTENGFFSFEVVRKGTLWCRDGFSHVRRRP